MTRASDPQPSHPERACRRSPRAPPPPAGCNRLLTALLAHAPACLQEATVVCVDNSEYTRNGDYAPTRFQAQVSWLPIPSRRLV